MNPTETAQLQSLIKRLYADGMTIEEAEHAMATRLYQNTARVHFNLHTEKVGRFGRRLIYGGHIISLARALSFGIMNIYAVKVAGVFMISTSTIAIYTGIATRWIAYLGYVAALLLIFGGSISDWVFIVFPLWVLLVSICILLDKEKEPLA